MKVNHASVTTMETNINNTRLFSADSVGFISVWNIERYCIDSVEQQSPGREKNTSLQWF